MPNLEQCVKVPCGDAIIYLPPDRVIGWNTYRKMARSENTNVTTLHIGWNMALAIAPDLSLFDVAPTSRALTVTRSTVSLRAVAFHIRSTEAGLIYPATSETILGKVAWDAFAALHNNYDWPASGKASPGSHRIAKWRKEIHPILTRNTAAIRMKAVEDLRNYYAGGSSIIFDTEHMMPGSLAGHF